MTQLIENYLDEVMYPGGINTNKNLTIGGSANFDQSGSSGTFKTGTGQVSLNGNVVLAAGKSITGGVQNVVSGSGATASLTAAQSGSVVLFDRAAGIVFTLPAPTIGLWYEFIVTTTITSNNAEVDTDAGTTFLMGGVDLIIGASATTLGCAGNGTSHVKIQMNGTTKGGILGSQLWFTCVSATQWNVSGTAVGSGTLATMFA